MPKFTTLPPSSFQITEAGLTARQFVPSDAQDLLKLALSENVKTFVPWAKWVIDAATAARQISEFQQSFKEGVRVRYVVENSGVFVGYIGMWPDEKADYYEFGFAILPQFRGQGYGTAAVNALLMHAENDLHATGVVAYVRDSNESSKAVVTKLGFSPLEEFDDGDRRYERKF